MQDPTNVTTLVRGVRIHKSYRDEVALSEVDITIEANEFVAITGRSGSGKSTLLRILAGVEAPDQGEVWFQQKRVDQLSDRDRSRLRLSQMGFVFQSAEMVPELTLRENVALPIEILGGSRREAQERADDLLREFGVSPSTADRVSGEVSGGQLQRAAVARAVVTNPAVVFADEPTGALDSQNGELVMQVLLRLRERGSAVVLVTHDASLANRADRVVRISDGALDQEPASTESGQ